MKKKTIASFLLCVLLLVAFLLTPFGLPGVMDMKARNEAITQRKTSTDTRLSMANRDLITTVLDVNDSREFDVFYSDLENIGGVFTSMGITIDSLYTVNPMDGFKEVAPYISGTETNAVCYHLTGDSVLSIFGVLEQMELPIYSVIVTGDNHVDVTFLTGGTL